jgi:hypothetical protein
MILGMLTLGHSRLSNESPSGYRAIPPPVRSETGLAYENICSRVVGIARDILIALRDQYRCPAVSGDERRCQLQSPHNTAHAHVWRDRACLVTGVGHLTNDGPYPLSGDCHTQARITLGSKEITTDGTPVVACIDRV